MSEPVIELEKLSFSYDGTPVLRDIDLCIHAREFVCIVGPNGGGKTTLLRLILGLLRPTQGRILVLGQSPERARRRIGYMPQYSQLDPQFPVTVQDVVLMGRLGNGSILGRWRPADRKAAERALADVGLNGFERRPFAALSGGQRQRALIARALACAPSLLLMDEPTSNLDQLVQDDFFSLLLRLRERTTVVLVSHDIGFVAQHVQRVICVNRTAAEHPTSELTGDAIAALYGQPMRMIRHDHHEHHHHHDQ